MSSNSKRIVVRSTHAQLRLLVEYMAANRLFAMNEFPGPMGPQNLESQWASLTDLLAKHGPAKSADQWKITWRDLKKKARQEGAKVRFARGVTGNHMPVPVLKELYSTILDTIGRECAEGLSVEGESIIGEFIELPDSRPSWSEETLSASDADTSDISLRHAPSPSRSGVLTYDTPRVSSGPSARLAPPCRLALPVQAGHVQAGHSVRPITGASVRPVPGPLPSPWPRPAPGPWPRPAPGPWPRPAPGPRPGMVRYPAPGPPPSQASGSSPDPVAGPSGVASQRTPRPTAPRALLLTLPSPPTPPPPSTPETPLQQTPAPQRPRVWRRQARARDSATQPAAQFISQQRLEILQMQQMVEQLKLHNTLSVAAMRRARRDKNTAFNNLRF